MQNIPLKSTFYLVLNVLLKNNKFSKFRVIKNVRPFPWKLIFMGHSNIIFSMNHPNQYNILNGSIFNISHFKLTLKIWPIRFICPVVYSIIRKNYEIIDWLFIGITQNGYYLLRTE